MLRVAWVHNFPPSVQQSGLFMHSLAAEVESQGVAVHRVYAGLYNHPLGLVAARRRIPLLLSGCDIVHVQYGSACAYVSARIDKPKLLTLRGSDWYGITPSSVRDHLHDRISRRMTCRALPFYDRVIVMSERMKDEVRRAGYRRPIDVLPDGLDLDMFSPMPRSVARRQLGVEDDGCHWVLFSALTPHSPLKRLEAAESAVSLAAQTIPGLKLKVISDAPHSTVPLWLNACDVVLLASTHEGWPNIIKEALACNRSFVSTDVSDLRRICETEPRCRVVDGTPEDMAQALIDVLRSPQRQELRRHVEHMALRETASRLISIYEGLRAVPVSSRPRPRRTRKMRVAWVHNFPPSHPQSGVFMYPLAAAVERLGTEVLQIYAGLHGRPHTVLRARSDIARLVAGCDLVHVQYGSACGMVAAGLPLPKVLTLRGSDWYGIPRVDARSAAHDRLGRWMTRRSIRRYQGLLVVSNRMKAAVIATGVSTPIEVLPSGIDLQLFSKIDRQEARDRLGFGNDMSPWVLFATLDLGSPLKRTLLATEATALAAQQVPGVTLKLLHDTPHNKIPLWINASDVVLVTSTHEGWPNIVKEALACDVPFVSTDVSDLSVIAASEPSCRVVGDSPTELASALIETISNRTRPRLRHYVEGMDLETVAVRINDYYEFILQG